MKSLFTPNRSGSSALRDARAVVGLLVAVALVGLVLSGICWRLQADEPAMNLGKGKDFFVPDYYDPPNQNQIKSLTTERV